MAYQQGAHYSKKRAGEQVTGVMRRHHHPADSDEDSVQPNKRAGARPNRANRDGCRESSGSVARRNARIVGAPAKRRQHERTAVRLNEWASTSDYPLKNGNEESRKSYCGKNETQSYCETLYH